MNSKGSSLRLTTFSRKAANAAKERKKSFARRRASLATTPGMSRQQLEDGLKDEGLESKISPSAIANLTKKV